MTTGNNRAFVNFWKDVNYNGLAGTYRGPLSVANVGKELNDTFDSVTCGDSAWVTLYSDQDFKGKTVKYFGPNSTINNLTHYDLHDAATSFEIAAARPKHWPGTSVATRGNTLTNERSRAANYAVKKLAVGVVSMVPVIGDVFGLVLDLIWPFGRSNEEVWEQMKRWLMITLYTIASDISGQISENKIEDLAKLINRVKRDFSRSSFDHLYNTVIEMENDFFEPTIQGVQNLTYLTIFGTIALTVYRLGYFCYDEIAENPDEGEDEDKTAKGKAYRLETLKKAIVAYRTALQCGYQDAYEKRLACTQLGTEHRPKALGADTYMYFGYDDYSGWQGPKYAVQTDTPDRYPEAREKAQRDVDYYRAECAAATFEANFAVYRQAAALWSYFDLPYEEARDAIARNTHTRRVFMGLWGRPFDPANLGTTRWKRFVEANQTLNAVTLYGTADRKNPGEFCSGIAAEIDRKTYAPEQYPSDLKAQRIGIAPPYQVTGIFGACGGLLDNVTLRVEDLSSSAGAPVEQGMGWSVGGGPFAASGPEGAAEARFAGFSTLPAVNSSDLGANPFVIGGIGALGTYWDYEEILPRG